MTEQHDFTSVSWSYSIWRWNFIFGSEFKYLDTGYYILSDKVLLRKIMNSKQKSQTWKGSFDLFEFTSQNQHSQVLK